MLVVGHPWSTWVSAETYNLWGGVGVDVGVDVGWCGVNLIKHDIIVSCFQSSIIL